MGSRTPQCLIDGSSHGFSATKVGVIQQERKLLLTLKFQWNSTFHHRSVGNSGRVRMVELFYIAVSRYRISSHDERALGLGIDLAIRAIEWSHQEQTTLKTSCIARRRDRNVQLSTRASKRR